jgi:hypothetical protein
MRTRLIKEIQIIFPLWLVVTLAGLVPRLSSDYSMSFGLWEFLSVVGFYVGIPLLAVLPIGLEFHFRTFPMLLAQPVDRRRIWAEKMLIITGSVFTTGSVYAFGWETALYRDPETKLTAILWLVMTVCSAVFCTLMARSLIGGLFLIATQVVLFVASFLGMVLLSQPPSPNYVVKFSFHAGILLWIATILFYSLLTLRLGRRAFLRFEDSRSENSNFLSGRPRLQPRLFGGWLRSRPSAPLFNLVAKEARLLWPIGVFGVLGTFAVAALEVWRFYASPDAQLLNRLSLAEFIVATFFGGLAVFLSGTLSMGEEKALGVQAWHIVLPISLRTQWLVKFVMTLIASVLAMAPVLIASAAGFDLPDDLERLLDPILLWVVALTVVLGFWCASAVKGTSRALLWLCPVIAIVGVGAKVGVDLSLITKSGRLLDSLGLLDLQFSPQAQDLLHEMFRSRFAPAVIVISVLIAAMVQSYRLFRMEMQDGHTPLLRALVPLVIIAVLSGFAQETLEQASYRHRPLTAPEGTIDKRLKQ